MAGGRPGVTHSGQGQGAQRVWPGRAVRPVAHEHDAEPVPGALKAAGGENRNSDLVERLAVGVLPCDFHFRTVIPVVFV